MLSFADNVSFDWSDKWVGHINLEIFFFGIIMPLILCDLTTQKLICEGIWILYESKIFLICLYGESPSSNWGGKASSICLRRTKSNCSMYPPTPILRYRAIDTHLSYCVAQPSTYYHRLTNTIECLWQAGQPPMWGGMVELGGQI